MDVRLENFVMWETKNENVHELLGDDNNRPSFDYRENVLHHR